MGRGTLQTAPEKRKEAQKMLTRGAVAGREGRQGIKMGTGSRALNSQGKDPWGDTFTSLKEKGVQSIKGWGSLRNTGFRT